MPTRRRTRSSPKQSSPREPKQRLIEAALDLAVQGRWRRAGMAEIAAIAHVPLAEAYGLFRSKFAILAAFRRGIDETVLAGTAGSASDSDRDRVFDVLMRRFEALQPHRVAIQAMLRDSIGDPMLIKTLPGLLRSMSWMLEAAGIATAGCRGRLACRLITALYLSVLPSFLKDEGADLGTTMAILDRRLRQIEGFLGAFRPLATRLRKSRT